MFDKEKPCAIFMPVRKYIMAYKACVKETVGIVEKKTKENRSETFLSLTDGSDIRFVYTGPLEVGPGLIAIVIYDDAIPVEFLLCNSLSKDTIIPDGYCHVFTVGQKSLDRYLVWDAILRFWKSWVKGFSIENFYDCRNGDCVELEVSASGKCKAKKSP